MAKPVMDTTMIKNENGTVTVPLYSRDGWHVGDAIFLIDLFVLMFYFTKPKIVSSVKTRCLYEDDLISVFWLFVPNLVELEVVGLHLHYL